MPPEVLTREESGALLPATARLDSPCPPRHPDLTATGGVSQALAGGTA